LLREARAFFRAGAHPHVVTYYNAWQESGYLNFQMELCPGGSLREVALAAARDNAAGPFVPEHLIWSLLGHVGAALAHLHAAGIVHLDVKPDNVFLGVSRGPLPSSTPTPALKLGDLGLAVEFAGGVAGSGAFASSAETSTVSEGSAVAMADGDDTRVSGGAAGFNNMSGSAAGCDDTEGDSRYMAPELLAPGGRAPPADLFSLGMSAFELAWDVRASP
jgi:serine/threonine protein kinase